MSETITLHALDLSGETAMKLFLRKDDGTLLNTDGDALTEISSSGVFTATLGEARTGLGTLSVRVCDGTETADNLLIDDFLPESSTVIGSKVNAELDSDAQAMVNAFNAMRSGNVFTEEALANAPGGSTTVTVLPATGIAADRTAGTTLLPVVGETISQAITVYQSDGMTAVDLSGKTLKVIFETMSGVDVAVVAAADITISGADDNVVTFAYPSAVTSSERTLRFAIRDAAAPLTMYLQGICSVVAAPKVDA